MSEGAGKVGHVYHFTVPAQALPTYKSINEKGRACILYNICGTTVDDVRAWVGQNTMFTFLF